MKKQIISNIVFENEVGFGEFKFYLKYNLFNHNLNITKSYKYMFFLMVLFF
jgi:hypothetical protein